MGAVLRVLIPAVMTSRRLAHLPGPPAHSLIAGQGDYMRAVVAREKNTPRAMNMFDVWLVWAKEYGPLFHYRHYHRHIIPVVYGADDIKRVLHDVSNTRHVIKDSLKFYQGIRMLGDNGILVSPRSEAWRIKKCILRQFMNPKRIAAHEETILGIINRTLLNASQEVAVAHERSEEIEVEDVFELLQGITSDILGQCLFDKNFGCSSAEQTEYSQIAKISAQIARECFAVAADPTRKIWFRNRAAKKETCRNILEVRNIARTIIEDGSPLTNKFLESFWDIEDLIDDISSILFAGQDTTSNALTYALTSIAHNRDVREWLREEISATSSTASWNEVNQLPRLDAVVKETLRLYPSAPLTLRALHKDHMLGGYKVPRGSTVWISPYTAGRNPNVWNKAGSFYPQRFVGRGNVDRGDFFPFMTGPHGCSGKHFALVS